MIDEQSPTAGELLAVVQSQWKRLEKLAIQAERVQSDLAVMREESRRLLERIADVDANPVPDGAPGARWASVSSGARHAPAHVRAAPDVVSARSVPLEGTMPRGRPGHGPGTRVTGSSTAGRALIAAAILGVCAWTAGTSGRSGPTHTAHSPQVAALVQR